MKRTGKWTAVCFLLSLFSLSCPPPPRLNPPPPPPPPPPGLYTRVVVMTATQNRAMDATSGGVAGYSADDAAADIVADVLQSRGYRVVERKVLNAVLREKEFQRSGMVDQATAVRAGKVVGAEAIVIANVYNTSKEYHQGFQGETGNVWVNTVWKVFDPSGMVSTVEMGVKMIDVQTADVAWSANKSEQSRPGETTSYIELLKRLVAALPFPSPPTLDGPTKDQGGGPTPPPPVNSEVKQAQGRLKELRYDPGPVDGHMGQQTHKALRQFQRDHNLPDTGQLDAATKAALQQPSASSSPPPTTDSSPPPY